MFKRIMIIVASLTQISINNNSNNPNPTISRDGDFEAIWVPANYNSPIIAIPADERIF
jgi:hypothetical protein